MTTPEDNSLRKEIERRIHRYSEDWRAYGDIEDGKMYLSVSPQAKEKLKDALSLHMRKTLKWLAEHGVPETALIYDPDTRSYRLPDDWTPTLGT